MWTDTSLHLFTIVYCSTLIVYTNIVIFNILLSFYDRSAPIYTQPRYLPPSKMLDADITDSVIGEGCVTKVINY